MEGQTPKDPKPRKKRAFGRRIARLMLFGLVLVVAGLASVPWLLGTSSVRSTVVTAMNRAVAPSRVGIQGISASWLGRIELTGLSLKNGKCKTLIEAKKAVLNRGLLALARDHSNLGVLTVTDANVDIERGPDGSIDLVDALIPPDPKPAPAKPRPSKSSGPGIDITLKVVGGTLKLASPELAEPLVADSLNMEVRVPSAANAPLSWKIRLAKPKNGDGDETLGIDGSYEYQAAAEPATELAVHGKRWPFSGKLSGIAARGRLDGAIEVDLKGSTLKTAGDARILDLNADGTALNGDTFALETVGGTWELGQTPEGWAIRHLDLKAPFANLQGSGEVVTGSSLPNVRLTGSVDLALLSKQVPRTLRIREGLTLEKGSANLNLDLHSDNGTQTASLDAGISELSARNGDKAFTLKETATVNLKGNRNPSGFSLETLRIKTAFLDVSAQGDLAKGLSLTGHVDLGAIEAQFHELIDFKGVELAGKGRMAGDYRKNGATFVARYATEIRGLKVAGMTTEPILRDSVRFDAAANGPIDPSGIPTSIDIARINMKSPQDTVKIATQLRADAAVLNATASLPMKVMARDGQVDIKLIGKYRGSSQHLDFDELRLGLKPLDPALNGAGTLAFAGQGSLDLAADEIKLTPLPVEPGEAIALAAEGMMIHGLLKTPTDQRTAKILLNGDFAAIDRALNVWTGSELHGLGGSFNAMVGMGAGDPGSLNLACDLTANDLTTRSADGKSTTPEGPLVLSSRAGYVVASDRLDFSKLLVDSRYAKIEAAGSLGEPEGRRVANLKGTLAPNWETLSGILRRSVEPNATLTGDARPFQIQGPLSGDSLAGILKGLEGEIGLNLTSADAFGMRLGPAPIVVRLAGGNATVDEIKSTLNGGVVDLKPGLTIDEKAGIALIFYAGTKIEGAAINDEVSRRVLRYVAPVLDKATNVTGKINLAIENGDIPITGPPSRTMTLNGLLAFQDVNFAPGPFATQVLSVVGKGNTPGLKIQEPINLSIANSRVIQKGLEIPINGKSSVEIAGSVGFDETLDLRASVPLNKAMLGKAGGLDELVGGEKITVPIGGTVSQPKINRQALQVALKGLVKSGLAKEASGFLEKLGVSAGGKPGQANGVEGEIDKAAKSLEKELFNRLLPKR